MIPPDALQAEEGGAQPAAPAAPGLFGVVALPGLALWRKTPVVASLLFNAGVTAPLFAVALVLLHAGHLVGLLTQPNVLRCLVLVGLAAITSRLIAVWLTADRVRDPVARRQLRVVGSAIVIALAVPTVFAMVRLEQARGVVEQVFQTSPNAGQVSVAPGLDPLAEQFHTVLLMGSDEGSNRLGLRTDTMILAMVHRDSGRVALVSVPRNLKHLQFPPGSLLAHRYPKGYTDGEGGLINALYITVENDPELKAEYGTGGMEAGVRALMAGLSYSLGVSIDDYALINSCGFVKLVDAVGGVTIHVDKELPMPGKLNCSNYRLPLTIGPGDIYMDGTKALGYVRSREADSDYNRMERQRTLIQTIASEVGIGDLLLRFGDLADAVKDNVRTSMTVDEARNLLATLQNTTQDFQSVGLTPPLVEPGRPDYDAIKQLLQQIRTAVADGSPLDLPTDTTTST